MFAFTVILTSTMNQQMDTFSSYTHSHVAHEINYRLAERSLGSSGSGNTSGRIDSQLAVYHLLSLPVKVAFKVSKFVMIGELYARYMIFN